MVSTLQTAEPVSRERRIRVRRNTWRRGGRRCTDLHQPVAAMAPAGPPLPDRVAYLEGSLGAAWKALDGHFERFRDTQTELARLRARVQELVDVVQILTARTNREEH